MDPICTIFIIVVLISIYATLILWLVSLVWGSPDTTTEDAISVIRLTGREARRQMDEAADVHLRKVYEYLRR